MGFDKNQMKMTDIFKNYLSLLIVVVLLFALPISATAKSSINFNEKIQTENNSIFYEIEISPGSNICALSFVIQYSESQVKVNKCSVGEILNGGISKSNSSIGGKIIFTYISITPLDSSGSVISVEFEILSSDNKNIKVECEITECLNVECDDLLYTFSKEEILNPKYIEPSQSSSKDTHTGNTTVNNENKHEQTSRKNSTKPNGSATEPTINGDMNSNTLINDDRDESGLSVTKNTESKEVISDDKKKQTKQDKTDGKETLFVALACVGAILLVSCLIIFKSNLMKRGKNNGKR